jgi:hypothetical protein
MLHSSRHVAEVLLNAINGIEQNADIAPDHPDLVALKSILDQKVAALDEESFGSVRHESLSDAA